MKNRLKEFRESKRLSQRDLSIASGVSQRTIWSIEKGNTEPSGKNMLKLSIALDIIANDIFILEEKDFDCRKMNNEK